MIWASGEKVKLPMLRYKILQCLCLHCHWFWEVVAVKFDSHKEQCPECRSFTVKTALKNPMLKKKV